MSEWSPLERAGASLAPSVGPFPRAGFVEAWWRHRGRGTPVVVEDSGSALGCVIDGGAVMLAGEPDLTDYHSPLGDRIEHLVARLLAELPSGTRVSFDSLPGEAAHPLAGAMTDAGVPVTGTEHAATMVLDLPDTVDEHLAGLEGRHRHEIRRKGRRFEELVGEAGLRRDHSGFQAFVEMHRAAPGDKGAFMTPSLEAFFRDLLSVPGAVLDLLVGSTGRPVAAAFGFEDEGAYYLYNSSFDASVAAASPGIILCDALIRAAITSGKRRFDFLKGREGYKRRFGAHPRPLTLIEGRVP